MLRSEMAPQHYSVNIHIMDVTETPKPTFRLASTLLLGVITGPVRMYHLNERVAIMWSHPYVVLWDWASEVACKWYVDKLAGIEPQVSVADAILDRQHLHPLVGVRVRQVYLLVGPVHHAGLGPADGGYVLAHL